MYIKRRTHPAENFKFEARRGLISRVFQMQTAIAKPLTLLPDNTLLVIVDMENEFCNPNGKLYSPTSSEIIPPLKLLLQRARSAGVQVVFIQSVRSRNDPQFTVFGREFFLLENSWGSQIIDELKPRASEPVVTKRTHDCFYKTDLDNLLEKMNIKPCHDTILITGVASNVCVYHAVLGFHVRHYYIAIPTDCVASRSKEYQEFVFRQFSLPSYSYNITLTRSDLIKLESVRP